MMRYPAARQDGFTLLELLVGLVVLGFILAGLSEGVRYGQRATDAQSRLSGGHDALDAVDRVFRRLVAQADPGDAHSGPTLQGSQGRLALVSGLPDAASGSGSQEADIAIGVDAGHRLMLRWTPHLHAKRFGPPPAPQQVELLQGVERVELAYWSDGWHPDWAGPSLPGLVRLRLTFLPGDKRRWPDIVEAPMRRRPG